MYGLRVKVAIVFVLVAFLAGCAARAGVSTPESTAAPAAPAPAAYWPTDGWRAATPEEQGMDSEKLAQMVESIQEEQLPLHSLLIVRNGYLVTELYVHPYSAGQVKDIQSVTKSVTGALVGIAIERGFIKDVRQPLLSLLPDVNAANLDDAKKAITLEDMLTLTAGLDCSDIPASDRPVMQASENWVEFMLSLPMAETPGKKFNYCTGAVHVLSAVLQKATGMTAREFANQELFAPIGISPIPEARWQSDPQGVTLGGYGLALTPGEMAKIGYLYLQQGKWDGKQVVPAEWVTASTTKHTQKDDGKGYGYLWTIDAQGRYYAALGRAGQHIFVFPGENLVVVFNADLPFTNNLDLIPLEELLNEYILPSIKPGGPLPANPGAQARIEAGGQALAEPKRAVQPLPAIAAKIHGQAFTLKDNPFGWRSITFAFWEGDPEARIIVDDSMRVVGLDNLYRTVKASDSIFPEALRGHWENEDTLIVDSIWIGQITQYEYRIQFTEDTVRISQRDKFSGAELELVGVRGGG